MNLPTAVTRSLVLCLYLASGLALAVPIPAADVASGFAAERDPLAPITVGPREAVGKKGMGEKWRRTAGRARATFSGGGGGKTEQPKLQRDPTRKVDYAGFDASAGDVETGARAIWSDDGLLVSTRVEEADEKGTFQTLFLQTCDGRRLYPQRYEIYQLWSESSLSVSWSKTSTANGQVVSQESSGSSNAWTDDWGGATDGLPSTPAIWQQLGFDRAEGGAQRGAYFNLAQPDLEALGEVSLIVHTTLPARDPVSTVASHWLVRPGAGGGPVLTEPATGQGASAWQDWSNRCEVVSPMLLAAAGTAVAAPAAIAATARAGYPVLRGSVSSRRAAPAARQDISPT